MDSVELTNAQLIKTLNETIVPEPNIFVATHIMQNIQKCLNAAHESEKHHKQSDTRYVGYDDKYVVHAYDCDVIPILLLVQRINHEGLGFLLTAFEKNENTHEFVFVQVKKFLMSFEIKCEIKRETTVCDIQRNFSIFAGSLGL